MTYEAKANHDGPVSPIPAPKSVTVTMPWRDFVAMFLLVARAGTTDVVKARGECVTQSARPKSDLEPTMDLYGLFSAIKPIYTGEEN